MKRTFVILLAGGLSSAPASFVDAGQSPGRGRTLQRHLSVPAVTATHFQADDIAGIAARWGVAMESLRLASGGYMLEFRYRVIDAAKAQPLFNRKTKATLRDDGSGLLTFVPDPPTTGALRSSNDAKVGRTYFMFFANPGRYVKVGNSVTVTIGDFSVGGIPVIGDPVAQERAQ